MSRIRVFIMMCSALLISAIAAHAATGYVYVSIEPKPEWNAIHLYVNGMDDLGKMVGQTIEADGLTARPWRYMPGVQPSPMMRWNQGMPPSRNSVFDINNRGWLVQIGDPKKPWELRLPVVLPDPSDQRRMSDTSNGRWRASPR